MADAKYSPSNGGGDFPVTIETAQDTSQPRSSNAPQQIIDLFNDQPSTNVAPPPNDIYIGQVISSGESSNMQPGVSSRNRTSINPAGATVFTSVPVNGITGNGNTTSFNATPLSAEIRQEWDDVTEVTILSSRLRILFIFEFLIILVNGIGFPWAFLAMPFSIIGYLSARWFKVNFAVVGLLSFVIMVPISIVTATQVNEEGFAKFVLIVLCIIAICWHIYVGYLTYKFITVLKKLSEENLEQVQREMPPVCGCL